MAKYMFTFSYTPEVWAALIQNPENREEKVAQILSDAGCKLHGLWYAFGDTDGFALMEAPSNTAAAGLALAIGASGAFSKFATIPVMSQEETLQALEFAAESVHYSRPAEAVTA